MTAIQQTPAAHEASRTVLPAAHEAPLTGPPVAPVNASATPAPNRQGCSSARAYPNGRQYMRVKRVVDALLAAAALILLAPVIAFVWVAVLVRLGRPALFLQERVTMGGRRFRLGKFRTMLPVDPARGWVTDAQRLTPFGSWLRASSLDELPSLWNILVGDMSIVGPRPLLPRYLSIYSEAQHGRHSVRAGLTGLAQVSGRNNLPWDARLDLDLRYVLLMGPLLDLTIIVRTVTAVLSRDGVVEGDLSTSTVFPGPYWTPRVRFEPRGASAWAALTPEDVHIAKCGFRKREGPATGEACAELFIAWAGEGLDQRGVTRVAGDVVTLLVSRARGADCTTARIRLPDARPLDATVPDAFTVLSRACREAGFHPVADGTGADAGAADVEAGDVEAGDGTTGCAVLVADIRCVDDPTPRGAGR